MWAPLPCTRHQGRDRNSRAAGCRRRRDPPPRTAPVGTAGVGWPPCARSRPPHAPLFRPPHAPLFPRSNAWVPHTLGPHRPPAHGEQLWRAKAMVAVQESWPVSGGILAGRRAGHAYRLKKNVSLVGSFQAQAHSIVCVAIQFTRGGTRVQEPLRLKISRGSEIIYKRIRNRDRRREQGAWTIPAPATKRWSEVCVSPWPYGVGVDGGRQPLVATVVAARYRRGHTGCKTRARIYLFPTCPVINSPNRKESSLTS